MRAVVQRVKESRGKVKGETIGAIGPGLLILLGVGKDDAKKDSEYLARKIVHLRVFPDTKGHMNLSLIEVGGAALVARAAELNAEYPESKLAGKEHTILEIEDAALAGDQLALQVAQEAAAHLGRAVASLLNLLNPSLVVVGGDLARLGDLLLDLLEPLLGRRIGLFLQHVAFHLEVRQPALHHVDLRR